MEDITRILKSLENLSVLIDGVNETLKHEMKKQEDEFLGMLLRTLGASMLGNMFTGRWVMRAKKVIVSVVR